MRLAALAAGLLLLPTPSLALDGPEDTVRALYAPDAMPDTAAEGARFLSADNAKAYAKQLKSKEVEPAVGFDWRCDCQDGEMTELTIGRALPIEGTRVAVKVDFKLDGEPRSLTYELCLGRKGWRIADLKPATGEWTLRELLGLKDKPVKC